MSQHLSRYYVLTKPGIIYGNLLPALAGFVFATTPIRSAWRHAAPVALLLAMLVGLGLVIASACVVNNYTDRALDRKMARTRTRALAAGTIPVASALFFAALLGAAGFAILGYAVNVLAALLAAAGFLAYTVLYGLAKRASHWGTVVGSVSGAMPVVVGYAAAAGHLDPAALALFAAMALWQMPHFYAIALYRRDEYAAAGVPVLPLVKGVRATKVHIVWYILAYLVAASFPTILGAAGYTYLAIVLASGVAWLWVAIRSFTAKDDARAARTTFRLSLVVVSAFSVALVLSPVLP